MKKTYFIFALKYEATFTYLNNKCIFELYCTKDLLFPHFFLFPQSNRSRILVTLKNRSRSKFGKPYCNICNVMSSFRLSNATKFARKVKEKYLHNLNFLN